MAKPVKGSTTKDVEFHAIMGEVKKITSILCKNQSQGSLRAMAYKLKMALAKVELYESARNQQGRGGLKKDK